MGASSWTDDQRIAHSRIFKYGTFVIGGIGIYVGREMVPVIALFSVACIAQVLLSRWEKI